MAAIELTSSLEKLKEIIVVPDETTSLVLKNRLVRKAKIILSQGLLVALSGAIIYSDRYTACRLDTELFPGPDYTHNKTNDWVFPCSKDIPDKVKDLNFNQVMKLCHGTEQMYTIVQALFIFFILIPVVYGLFHFFHGICIVEKNKAGFVVNPKIERRFKSTNVWPFVDTAIEIPIAWKHGMKSLLIINLMIWLAFTGGAGYLLFRLIKARAGDTECKLDFGLIPTSLWIAAANAIFASYRFFGETNEYWVYYRTGKPQTDNNDKDKDYFNKKLEEQYYRYAKLGIDKEYEEAKEKFGDRDEAKDFLETLGGNRDDFEIIMERTRQKIPQEMLGDFQEELEQFSC